LSHVGLHAATANTMLANRKETSGKIKRENKPKDSLALKKKKTVKKSSKNEKAKKSKQTHKIKGAKKNSGKGKSSAKLEKNEQKSEKKKQMKKVTKQRKAKQKGGDMKKRNAKKTSRQTTGSCLTSNCLDLAVYYISLVQGKVANFQKQVNRIAKLSSATAAKFSKQNNFAKVLDQMILVGGGNISNLTCGQSFNNSGLLLCLSLYYKL